MNNEFKRVKKLSILSLLEKYHYDIKDLVFILDLEESEVKDLVKELWYDRKVSLCKNVWYCFLPITKPKEFDISINEELSTTLLGHRDLVLTKRKT